MASYDQSRKNPNSVFDIEMADSYDQSCNNPDSVAIQQQSTVLKKQSNLMLFIIIMSAGVVLFLVSIIWLCFMGFATTRVLVFIASLIMFFFGKPCMIISEGIIFVFLQRPFDIGDCCAVDNEQLIVEEIGILRTVFLKENNEKLYYQNSNLLTKSISNYNQSFETSDILELVVDVSTSVETLKLKIYKYLQSKPKNYCPEHSWQLKEREDVKLKFRLHITHAMKFKNYEEMKSQRSELLLELINLFEELGIKYFALRFLS